MSPDQTIELARAKVQQAEEALYYYVCNPEYDRKHAKQLMAAVRTAKAELAEQLSKQQPHQG